MFVFMGQYTFPLLDKVIHNKKIFRRVPATDYVMTVSVKETCFLDICVVFKNDSWQSNMTLYIHIID